MTWPHLYNPDEYWSYWDLFGTNGLAKSITIASKNAVPQWVKLRVSVRDTIVRVHSLSTIVCNCNEIISVIHLSHSIESQIWKTIHAMLFWLIYDDIFIIVMIVMLWILHDHYYYGCWWRSLPQIQFVSNSRAWDTSNVFLYSETDIVQVKCSILIL